jgi:Mrp family chromosome partitioning ATPase
VDSIRQAVELARAGTAQANASGLPMSEGSIRPKEIELNAAYLESMRIVAHGAVTTHGRYYDMLRTQVLQEMTQNSWQFLAVTSATAGCGKTVTACNLAMSIARLSEKSVLLVDLDFHKPKVAEYLGFKPGHGLLGVLEGRSTLSNAVFELSVGRAKMAVLPGKACNFGASEWMASQAMDDLLQTIKREFRSRVVIFDMPPMLLGDDVITILPHMDAVLLIAGVGQTTTADIKECQKHLKATPVLRVVVNKVTETTDSYYTYY